MKANPFAQYAQARFKMNGSREKSMKHRIVSFYRSLYDVNWGKSFLVTLFEPPMTFAKLTTYCFATMIISTGVYASVAPTSFARTSSVVKETVKASIDVIVAPLRNTNDVREDENEVFCDGERRDPEDCSENNEINNAQNES